MFNQVTLLGRLGNTPELRQGQKGGDFTRLNVATNTVWTDQSGERQERTDWHNVVVWGKQAKSCANYLEKGRMVLITGRLQTRTVDDGDGNKKTYTDVVADRVVFVGGGGGKAEGAGRNDQPEGYRKPPVQEDDSSVPF